MTSTYLTLTAKLPNGSIAEVSDIDLEEVWEKVSSKLLCDEFAVRCEYGDKDCCETAAACARSLNEPDAEEVLFQRLDDWTRAELLKAIREDDGRRCIDVLKHAAA